MPDHASVPYVQGSVPDLTLSLPLGAVSEGRAYCIDPAISQLEKKFDPPQFARIHRATLVNLAWIREVSPLPGGSLSLHLKDPKATSLTVARDHAHDFRLRVAL